MPENLYPEGYKDQIFYVWYNQGKLGLIALYNAIPINPDTGTKPAQQTLKNWIANDFSQRAEVLDKKVAEELEGLLLREKIAMLQKHAKLGVKMQDMAMNYLDAHSDQLTSSSAVRLLVEGVRIERGSRGMPEALEDMMKKDDDELLLEVENILANAPVVSEEPND